MKSGIKIDADLQQYQLQITTRSPLGSRQQIKLWFYGAEGWDLAGGITIYFSRQYWIPFCTKKFITFPTTLPTDQDKVWSIWMTEIGLNIECKGVLLVEYDTSVCDATRWSKEVKAIEFDYSDYSKEYRIISPGMAC